MNAPRRSRRRPVADGAAGVEAAALTGAAVELAADLVPLPLEYPDVVSDIAALIAGDPRNHEHVQAVVAAIVDDALGDPFRETTANRWRTALPPWLRPAVIGATVRRLIEADVLVATGRYARNTDVAGRNRGKLQPIYALNVHAAALRARAHDRAAAPAS